MRLLLGHAASQGRAVVTDNIPDFFACHQQRLDLHQTHWRLLFLINDTFARHRHDLFVSHVVAASRHSSKPTLAMRIRVGSVGWP